jgi:hypothetical protein
MAMKRVAAAVAVTVLVAGAVLVWLLFGGERIGPSPGIGPMVPSRFEPSRTDSPS